MLTRSHSIPYWCIEVWDGEPFLPKVSWTYVLKAFEWARKYGLRINLDLHTIPGSQNGWNHSGRFGQKNWMEGPMGYANAQRSLDYMRIIVQVCHCRCTSTSKTDEMLAVHLPAAVQERRAHVRHHQRAFR